MRQNINTFIYMKEKKMYHYAVQEKILPIFIYFGMEFGLVYYSN